MSLTEYALYMCWLKICWVSRLYSTDSFVWSETLEAIFGALNIKGSNI